MKQPVRKRIAEANSIQTRKQQYIAVIDGNNLLKIALVDKRENQDGLEYGGVLMFLKMLGGVLLKKDFDYCFVCWDGEGSGVLRWNYYKDYKANRDKHYEMQNDYYKKLNDYARAVIAYSKSKRFSDNTDYKETDEESFERQKFIIQSILEELCIRQHEYDKVEGDDIISYIVHNKHPEDKAVIVSSDKDLTQLISDTVIVYNPRTKIFITKNNSSDILGITHKNVVLEKVLCGDQSDNIKGVKGIGQSTLIKLFPEIVNEETNLERIIARSKELLAERKSQKKKPLKSLENIINGVTDGCQGNKLYEVNRKIIDLSEPLLTKESMDELDDSLYVPIDTSERDIKNVYNIIYENGMNDLVDEEKFGNTFSPYGRIIMMEKRRYENFLKKNIE
jgi:5'-3' exonuclease